MANITRYNPFSEAVSLREAMDRLFEDSFIPRMGVGGRGIASNLYETADGFVLQIPMPGANADAVEVTAQQDTLTVKWETRVSSPENATAHWSGFANSQYQQTFTLPAAINSERAEANYENGILTLSLPKAEHVKARSVKVTVKK